MRSVTKRVVLVGAVLGLVIGGAGRADAASIPLLNTGVNATGTPLSGGSSDPHWTIISGPGITTPQAAVVVNDQSGWLYAQNPNSRWIWVNASSVGGVNSPYDFRLTFDLTGLNPSTASITGSWGVDNFGQILLNGMTTGIGSGALILPASSRNANFQAFSSFTLNNGFVPGVNTLDILATDTGVIGAINVTNLAGTAQTGLGSVPEPASMILLGTGLLAVLGYACRGAAWT
jgi:hypothetical protein